MKVALAGAGGFLGRAIQARAAGAGHEVLAVEGRRLPVQPGVEPAVAAKGWIHENKPAFETLVRSLETSDVMICAAGASAPESRDEAALVAANAVLPAVLAAAAAAAGVPRFVHISSAVVQGRRDPLDESVETAPLTPYGRSKAMGEALLLGHCLAAPPELIVYRPTSVQSPNRAITRQLVRLASAPVLPVPAGRRPIPVALLDNVAAGIVHVCQASPPPSIVLQPWEGMTVVSLLRALGRAVLIPMPPGLATLGLNGLRLAGTRSARAIAIARRVEMLVRGQAQDAVALADLGFRVRCDPSRYAAMAAEVRAAAGDRAGDAGR